MSFTSPINAKIFTFTRFNLIKLIGIIQMQLNIAAIIKNYRKIAYSFIKAL